MPAHTVNTKFYTFSQNNFGGFWDLDENLGKFVIIEAIDHRHANARAEEIGIDFDRNRGDRWDRMDSSDEGDASEEPMIMDEPVKTALDGRWLRDYNAIVHYFDGTREEFKGPEFKGW